MRYRKRGGQSEPVREHPLLPVDVVLQLYQKVVQRGVVPAEGPLLSVPGSGSKRPSKAMRHSYLNRTVQPRISTEDFLSNHQ